MGNTYSTANFKDIYRAVLKEQECVKQRPICDKNCKECLNHVETLQMLTSLEWIKCLIKDRCPELHFIDDVLMLEEILNRKANKEGKDA